MGKIKVTTSKEVEKEYPSHFTIDYTFRGRVADHFLRKQWSSKRDCREDVYDCTTEAEFSSYMSMMEAVYMQADDLIEMLLKEGAILPADV
jgi:hypothetical protein